jgi:hypothetical protein
MEKPVSPSEDYALGTVLFCASSKPDLSRRGINLLFQFLTIYFT